MSKALHLKYKGQPRWAAPGITSPDTEILTLPLSEKETEGKTKEELSLEAKLLAWLNQHSLIQILDWFRCVDYVAATVNASASKWTTETTRRDQLFLKMLGVK